MPSSRDKDGPSPQDGNHEAGPHEAGQRVDRWLWYARFAKTRSVAATLVRSGKMRVSGDRISRPSRLVRPGDVLTFPLGAHIRVIRIRGLGTRRGPAPEARELYDDLDPPPERRAPPESEAAARQPAPSRTAPRAPGAGRPTKRERRATDRLKTDGPEQEK